MKRLCFGLCLSFFFFSLFFWEGKASEPFRWGFSAAAIEDVPRVQESGATWLRVEIAWGEVEPMVANTDLTIDEVTEDVINNYVATRNWSRYDRLIEELVSHRINPFVVIGNGYSGSLPRYNAADGTMRKVTPDNVGRDHYLALIYLHTRAAVRRYKDRVQHWQTENELNVAGETALWGWREGMSWWDWDLLTQILATLRDAITTEDREAKTTVNFHTDIRLLPVIYDWREDVRRWNEFIDFIGIDVYPNYVFGAPPLGAIVGERVAQARQFGLDKPVLVMETGYPTQPTCRFFSEESQSDYVAEAAHSAWLNGAAGFFYFFLRGRSEPADPPCWPLQAVESYWGLIRPDGTPKPAWYTYLEIIRTHP